MSVIPAEDTLKYTNEARTNPKQFASYVKKQLATFTSPTQMPLRPGCNYSTNEGKGAWTEAIAFLEKQAPLPAFQLHKGLCLAAEDHALDMQKTGIFGHNSSNGMSFSDRINRRCKQGYGSSGENIGSDFDVTGRNHALQTVMGLIIDDGVQSRGHRKNIFSKDFQYVGISSRNQGDKILTVMDFHSSNLELKDATNNNIPVKPPANNNNNSNNNFGGFGNSNKMQMEWGSNNGWGSSNNNGWGDVEQQGGWGNSGQLSNTGSGGRTVVSQSTNTKTQTINGVTKITKITKIKYSDGAEEENVEQTIKK